MAFYDIKAVAELLHVTTRTIQNYLADPDPQLRLTGVLLGNKWIFEESDIADFISRRRQHTELRRTSGELPIVRVDKAKSEA